MPSAFNTSHVNPTFLERAYVTLNQPIAKRAICDNVDLNYAALRASITLLQSQRRNYAF